MREDTRYLLDTNICIFLIKRNSPKLLHKIFSLDPLNICISSITLGELSYGVEKSQHQEKNRSALNKILTVLEVCPFDESAATRYGKIRADLERKGKVIGPLDTLIAAHALARDLILVTNNTREFKRVENLQFEDWTK